MGFMRNLLALLVAAAMAGLGVLFALQNPEPIALDILIMKLPPRSLALWVLLALALGGLLGLALSSFAMLRLRARLATARRQFARVQAELERQRSTELATRE
jgi:putative membrane protein